MLRDYHLTGLHKEAATRIEEYKVAQVAVQRKDWARVGIKSSEDYLRKIFEDDGKEIPAPISRPSDVASRCDSDENVDID